ncbi:MAG: hypothetical protein DRP50_07740 [Thermotoga sp.]|nr:MAG: hypothetical protein DRP50_07740 [Thermotoga sp.]
MPLLIFITILWNRGLVQSWAIAALYGLTLLASISGFFEFLKICFLLFYCIFFPIEPIALVFLLPKPFFFALITHNGFFLPHLSGSMKLDILLILSLISFILFSKYRVSMIFIWMSILVLILITAFILKYGWKGLLKAFSKNSGLKYEREDLRYLRRILRDEPRSEREEIRKIHKEIQKMVKSKRRRSLRKKSK